MTGRNRGNGFPSMLQLRGEVDRLLGDFFGGLAPTPGRPFIPARVFPAVNVWEQGDELVAEAELPGVRSEDVDISVTGSELTISGRRPEPVAEQAAYHRRERGVGEFSRTLHLPYDVDSEAVAATLHDGVLTIRLPKSAAARPRKIRVEARN